MESESNPESASVNESAAPPKATRAQRKIEFPYTDLAQAEVLADRLMVRGGGSAESQQLAGWLNQSANGGTFRTGLSAAKLFGFIETERGSVIITAEGKDVNDSNKAVVVRVDAFLRVPLFAALFDKFKGYPLPPPAAVERQMVELGVPPKQKERARQVFMKSAVKAGFVDAATGRLIKPAVQAAHDQKKAATAPNPGGNRGDGGDDGDKEDGRKKQPHNPFVEGLLSQLPQSDKYVGWTLEDQAEWLSAAASIFKLLSKAKGRIDVSIQLEKQTPPGANQTA